jgi:hypothetical protein
MFRPIIWSSSSHSCTLNQNYNRKFHFESECDAILLQSACGYNLKNYKLAGGVRVCAHVCLRVYVRACVGARVRACAHMCVCVCTCAFVCTCVCVCARARACVCVLYFIFTRILMDPVFESCRCVPVIRTQHTPPASLLPYIFCLHTTQTALLSNTAANEKDKLFIDVLLLIFILYQRAPCNRMASHSDSK